MYPAFQAFLVKETPLVAVDLDAAVSVVFSSKPLVAVDLDTVEVWFRSSQ
jgi:hypothetical protein